MSTACYTKDPDCIGMYEATDFFERYTERLRGKLNGDQDLEHVHEIEHLMRLELGFEEFKTSARHLFSALDGLKKELETKINKKLYCLSVNVKRLGPDGSMEPIAHKFHCRFLEMGDLK